MRTGLGCLIVQAGVVRLGAGCLFTVDFNFLFGTSTFIFLVFRVDFSSNIDFAWLILLSPNELMDYTAIPHSNYNFN